MALTNNLTLNRAVMVAGSVVFAIGVSKLLPAPLQSGLVLAIIGFAMIFISASNTGG